MKKELVPAPRRKKIKRIDVNQCIDFLEGLRPLRVLEDKIYHYSARETMLERYPSVSFGI